MKTFTHEEQYRGESLLKKIAVKSIVLCGVGAIGSNLADNLIRQGFQKITAIDFDRIEEHNRNNQIWGFRDVGLFKVTALKSYAFNALKVSIEAIDKKLDKSNIKKYLKSGDLVIDGFDNAESRVIVTEHCRALNIDCLHIGLAEDCAEVTWNESYRIPKDIGKDICEYALARNTALLSVVVGTESIIKFIDSGIKESYTMTLRDLKVVKV
jgi:molybdopterin/thiamine biosynthesis adenylyltransferase